MAIDKRKIIRQYLIPKYKKEKRGTLHIEMHDLLNYGVENVRIRLQHIYNNE